MRIGWKIMYFLPKDVSLYSTHKYTHTHTRTHTTDDRFDTLLDGLRDGVTFPNGEFAKPKAIRVIEGKALPGILSLSHFLSLLSLLLSHTLPLPSLSLLLSFHFLSSSCRMFPLSLSISLSLSLSLSLSDPSPHSQSKNPSNKKWGLNLK